MQDFELIFGGTFDPVHLGHLICARAAAEACGASRVRLIPAAISPHRTSAPPTPPADRLVMLELATAGDPMFVVDDLELHRPPPSYTRDTARLLRDRGVTFRWLIGTDQLRSLHRWHGYPALLDEVDFVVMRRAGEAVQAMEIDPSARKLLEGLVEVPAIAISATEIRDRVSRGLSIRNLVTPAVERYIVDHHLYSGAVSPGRQSHDRSGE